MEEAGVYDRLDRSSEGMQRVTTVTGDYFLLPGL